MATETTEEPHEPPQPQKLAGTDPNPLHIEVLDDLDELQPPVVSQTVMISADGQLVTFNLVASNESSDPWQHPLTIDLSDALNAADLAVDSQGAAFDLFAWADPRFSGLDSVLETTLRLSPGDLSANGHSFELAPEIPAGGHLSVTYTLILRPESANRQEIHSRVSLLEKQSSLAAIPGFEYLIDTVVLLVHGRAVSGELSTYADSNRNADLPVAVAPRMGFRRTEEANQIRPI